MADLKATQLTALTSVDKDDLLYIIDDVVGTPISKKSTVEHVLQGTNTLDALTTVDKADIILAIDDPSGTPTSKKSTVEDVLQATNTLDVNNTVLKTDKILIIDDPAETPKAEHTTIQNLFEGMDIEVNEDLDSDTDDAFLTGIASGIGILIVGVGTDTIAATYLIEGSTLTAISANVLFSTVKDNAATYNVYYETDQYKVQNKVGDNKVIKVKFIGV